MAFQIPYRLLATHFRGAGQTDKWQLAGSLVDRNFEEIEKELARPTWVAEGSTTVAHNGIGTVFTIVNNLAASVVSTGTRKYKVTGKIDLRQRTALGLVFMEIYENSVGTVLDGSAQTLGIDQYGTLSFSAVHTPAKGTLSYRLRVKTSNNTVDAIGLGYKALILVEDIGPA